MKGPIIAFFVVLVVLLTGLLLWMDDSIIGAIHVKAGSDSVPNSSLVIGQEYYLQPGDEVDVSDSEGLLWLVRSGNNDELGDVFGQEMSVPVYNFGDTGRYYIECSRNAKVIAVDSVYVRQGDRFASLGAWSSSPADTAGASIYLTNNSQNVAEWRWRVHRQGTLVAEEGGQSWNWTPIDTGSHMVRLDVQMRSGATHADSMLVAIAPPPPKSAVAPKPKPTPTPPAPRPKPAPKPKPTPKPKVDLAPPPPLAGACFGANRALSSTSKADMPDPKRADVRWEKGTTEFILDVHTDCKLKDFPHFANSEVAGNKVAVTVECISEGCTGESRYTRYFTPAFDSQKWASRSVNLPLLLAGKRYRVRVQPQGDTDYLGYFGITSQVVNTPCATITFQQNTSCVFDLGFQH